MLGQGTAVLGLLAAFHFAKEARGTESGLWPLLATGAAWLGTLLVAGVVIAALV